MQMNLAAVDLNLLVVLHAVLEKRSATRAAESLHCTQSAVSNALTRLRHVLKDPLVVRQSRGLTPTPFALQLQPRLADVITQLHGLVCPPETFREEATTRTFTVSCSDDQSFWAMPRVHALLRARMPNAKLRQVSVEFLVRTDGLSAGLVDVALAPRMVARPGFHYRHLFDEGPALIVRSEHPRIGHKLTERQFAQTPFVDVHVAGEGGVVNDYAKKTIASAGLTQNIFATVPHFMAAAALVAQTDFMAGVPAHFAAEVTRVLPVRVVHAPFMPRLEFHSGLLWHERTHRDPGAMAFRKLLCAALAEPMPPKSTARVSRVHTKSHPAT